MFQPLEETTTAQLIESEPFKELVRKETFAAIEEAFQNKKTFATLFEINTTGNYIDIPKQYWVEALEERFHGHAYTSEAGVIDIATSSTWVDIDFVGIDVTLGSESIGTVLATSAPLGLKNTSKKKWLVWVQATFDGHSLGNNEEMALRLVKQEPDGSPEAVPGGECHATGTANGVIAKLHSSALVEVKPGDEVWCQAANFTNTGDISFERGRILWQRVAGLY